MERFEGARVTVMGLGRFGGGVGVTRWLAARGAEVLVTDLAQADTLASPLAQIDDLVRSGRVRLRLGGHNVSDFTACDLVVANPAVPAPWDNRFLRAARAAGVPVTTEIRLAVERLPDRRRVIGVTGTAGKSTTAAMIHHALSALAPSGSVLGGNIGGSLLHVVSEAFDPSRWVVLELSSFMLYWLRPWSPGIAVVTNFSDNHLDWHGTREHYLSCKQAILESQQPADAAVLGPGLADWPTRPGVARIEVREDETVRGLSAAGAHNALNAAVATRACEAALMRDPLGGVTREQIENVLRSFPGLPHRLEFLGERYGRRFFNDSKSTTPGATLLAVRALAEPPGPGTGRIHLIVGGYDKGSDLSAVAALAGQLAGLYAIGATGPRLASAGGMVCGTLDAALTRAWRRSRPGDVIVLSPACASWDQFENYEARGEAFRRLVSSLEEA